jgi:hypothetical protein
MRQMFVQEILSIKTLIPISILIIFFIAFVSFLKLENGTALFHLKSYYAVHDFEHLYWKYHPH